MKCSEFGKVKKDKGSQNLQSTDIENIYLLDKKTHFKISNREM